MKIINPVTVVKSALIRFLLVKPRPAVAHMGFVQEDPKLVAKRQRALEQLGPNWVHHHDYKDVPRHSTREPIWWRNRSLGRDRIPAH